MPSSKRVDVKEGGGSELLKVCSPRPHFLPAGFNHYRENCMSVSLSTGVIVSVSASVGIRRPRERV